MKNWVLKMYCKAQVLLADEAGQDLIEYALVVALIAFAATTGMGTVASGINDSFSKILSKLSSAIA